ncbi:MAG: ArgE/DapE family deacylase [Acidobacteria bacterium]|nr:ArgE/DapE family deacylase [Acidobacteriota bacterium]
MSPVIETLADLVRINSVNPAYEGGKPEAEIAGFVERFFRERGIETRRQEVFPGRPNLIAALPGRNPARRIVFEAHTDTASVAGMSIPPFEPAISNGRLHGRGACDTKAGLAAMMHALAALKREGHVPPCEVWVVAAADEEYSYRGVLRLCDGLRAVAAVASEPTGLRCVIASKGCVRWRVTCRGKAAHSSKPHLGINAIAHMAQVVLAIEADTKTLGTVSHPLVGSPTCNVGVIRGGTQVNMVPDSCTIEIDRRLIPGEDTSHVLDHYRQILLAVKIGLPELDARMEPPMLEDVPLETPLDSPVAALASHILADMGLDGEFLGVPFGSDASKLSRRGIPSIVIGPGSIDQAHASVEYVECEQVERAFEFYRKLMSVFD